MENNCEIKFESGRYWIQYNIIRVKFIDKEKEPFTIVDADMHIDAYDQLTKVIGIVPILIDIRNVHTIISLDVLRYISKRIKVLNKGNNAKAYLINSLGVRLLVNFYVKVIVSETQSVVFENEAEALRWLQTFEK